VNPTHELGGYYRSAANFTLLAVPKGGHLLPANNIDATISFLADYVEKGALICHKTDGNKCNFDNGKLSDLMKGCNGQGTFDN